jgi:hypothetical protein
MSFKKQLQFSLRFIPETEKYDVLIIQAGLLNIKFGISNINNNLHILTNNVSYLSYIVPFFTHRSEEWQGQSSEPAGGDFHRPLASHDHHTGVEFVFLRLVVPVTVIYRDEHRLALTQKEKCVQ